MRTFQKEVINKNYVNFILNYDTFTSNEHVLSAQEAKIVIQRPFKNVSVRDRYIHIKSACYRPEYNECSPKRAQLQHNEYKHNCALLLDHSMDLTQYDNSYFFIRKTRIVGCNYRLCAAQNTGWILNSQHIIRNAYARKLQYRYVYKHAVSKRCVMIKHQRAIRQSVVCCLCSRG